MRFRLAQALFCLTAATAQTVPADWKTAAELPNVDLTGLTAARKQAALKALRGQTCVCTCGMQVAECRVKDPGCGDSRGLAEIIVKAIREGKNPELAVAGSELVNRRNAAPALLDAAISLPIEGAPVKGPAKGRITVVEFSDFECPYCSKAAAKIDAVLAAYPNDIRLVYKQYPLPNHPHARMAAQAALAAHAQNKFWPMHDKLFANSRRLSDAAVLAAAKEIGLDLPRFQTDLKSAKIAQIVDKDIADGNAAQISGTPTVFINGKRYNGPLELAIMKSILDAELKAKK